MSLYNLLFNPNEVCEIRAIGVSGKNSGWEGFAKSIVSGCYNDPAAFEKGAAILDKAQARGVYFTINPINPALLARAANRLKVPKSTSQDQDIVCIRWLPIDLDPKRPADISSNDEEVAAAVAKGKAIAAWLEGELGFAKALRAYSGNGFHLLYRLPDLPNNEETHKIIVAAMAAIKAKFDDDQVDIDPAVVNPARIWKCYGTTGRKGDPTADRPHRISSLFPKQPAAMADVPITALEALMKPAALVPAPAVHAVPAGGVPPPSSSPAPAVPVPVRASGSGPQGARRFGNGELGPLDVERYLTHYGIQFTIKTKGAQTLYILERCLFNPDHGVGEASIIAAPTGKSPLLYQCFHASCKDKRWKDARQIISGDKPVAEFCAGFDPNWKPPKTVGTGVMKDIHVASELAVESASQVPPPEKIDPLEMFEKRGKRPVFVPMYLAKYLAAFLGPIVHTSGTYWRYRDGLWQTFPETSIIQVIVAVMKDRAQGDMIGNTIKILNGLVNREEKAWPNDSNLLPLINGILDLTTMDILSHDPKYGARIRLPVNYDSLKPAWSDRWWKFLQEIFPDDESYEKRAILQQFFGYCFLRDCRHQAMMLLYGTGANGKSTALDCLLAIIGEDNAISVPLELLGDKFKSQLLHNKMVNIAGEISSRKPIETDMLKRIISGDPITVEEKYQFHFQFRPYAKLICAMNEAPVIPDKSYGFARRIIVVNFERRFTPEEIAKRVDELGGKKMIDHLIEEKDGIFAWALEGLKVLLRNHGFRISTRIQEDTDQIFEALNPILIFVNEMCEIHEGTSVETMDLWECYEEWCRAGHNRALSRNKFLEQVQQTFRVTRPVFRNEQGKKKRLTMFEGIGLTKSAQEWTVERKARFTPSKQQRFNGEE